MSANQLRPTDLDAFQNALIEEIHRYQAELQSNMAVLNNVEDCFARGLACRLADNAKRAKTIEALTKAATKVQKLIATATKTWGRVNKHLTRD